MRVKNIHILCCPLHSTRALQPGDKALIWSLKHHWDQAEGRAEAAKISFFREKKELFSLLRGAGMFPLNKKRILPPTLPSAPSRPQTPPALQPTSSHSATIPEAPSLLLLQDDEDVHEELFRRTESVPEKETELFNVFTPQDKQPLSSTAAIMDVINHNIQRYFSVCNHIKLIIYMSSGTLSHSPSDPKVSMVTRLYCHFALNGLY